MDKLYNYLFHYNPNTENWYAIPRDKYNDYWNNYEDRVNNGVLHAKDYQTLIDFLSAKPKK